jgi:hypothetical protein
VRHHRRASAGGHRAGVRRRGSSTARPRVLSDRHRNDNPYRPPVQPDPAASASHQDRFGLGCVWHFMPHRRPRDHNGYAPPSTEGVELRHLFRRSRVRGRRLPNWRRRREE